METLYKKNCIRTFTGKYVNIFKPEKKMFCIEDIAHALSKEQRFGNHLKKHYSVAQHSIICSELAPPKHKFTALMHDASEAYLRDIPTPIKEKLPEYIAIENTLMLFLADIFGFVFPMPAEVKKIDEIMLEQEWQGLMLGNRTFNYIPFNQAQAKFRFLRTYKFLKNK